MWTFIKDHTGILVGMLSMVVSANSHHMQLIKKEPSKGATSCARFPSKTEHWNRVYWSHKFEPCLQELHLFGGQLLVLASIAQTTQQVLLTCGKT